VDFEEVRKLTIIALFSDDVLYELLVLKGGNAMTLVHGISPRASLDLDFSMENGFEDLPDIQRRMALALADRFATVGFVPLDVKLTERPAVRKPETATWWGGYQLDFKLIDRKRYHALGPAKDRQRRESLVIAPNQTKTFTVDFSKHEYIGAKVQTELDDYTIFVYSPAMIALEKVRAICQQMEDYAPSRRTRSARARDFFDIHSVVTKTGFRFDAPEILDLTRLVFAAKEVPLSLLGRIENQREFHRPDWPAVRGAVAAPIEDFDFYFEFVLSAIEPLHALWME